MIVLDSCKVKKGNGFQLEVDTLMFEKNHKYFIVGASGSGKSTLLHVLLGLESFSGKLSKKSENQTLSVSSPLYKQGLMYLSQDFSLWNHMTVAQHINFTLSYGKSLAKHKESDYYLNLVNMYDKEAQKPYELSGGEKQRLALARALASKPEYLFLDEPFANIDIVQADTLMRMLENEQIKQGFSMIKVTHHFVGIKDTNSIIIILEKGKIIFQGTFLELQDKDISPWTNRWKELLA